MSNNAKLDEWKKREIGALWRKRLDNGKVMFSGSISVDGEEIRIVGFTVVDKKNPNQPDVKLYIDKKLTNKNKEVAQKQIEKNIPQNKNAEMSDIEAKNESLEAVSDEPPF